MSDLPASVDGDSWLPKSAEQIAVDQGITKPQDLDQFTGAAADLWSSDEEFAEFLALIDRHRPRPTSP